MAKKPKPKLEQPAKPKPAYVMPPPNSDAEAYNWELQTLRKPDPLSENKKDPDAGESIFRAPQEDMRTMRRYGHDAQFICPKYLQIILDKDPAIRKAAEAAADARYTKESIAALRKAVMHVFNTKVLPDIAENFEKAAETVAQFYAARVAHVRKFGRE